MPKQEIRHNIRDMLRLLFIMFTVLCVMSISACGPVKRGEDDLPIKTDGAPRHSGGSPFHALVIGNQTYDHLRSLNTPQADATEIAELLKKQYGFEVNLLLDKTRDEIMLALSDLRQNMTKKEDSLLIYYAGHGYLDKPTGTGYWLPKDAQTNNNVYWIPTDEISRLLKVISVRHVLVVSDSCYSGTLVTRDAGAQLSPGVELDELIKRMDQIRSRTALTAGGIEPVVDSGGGDHSVFAKAFIDVLRNTHEIMLGDTLFNQIRRRVVLNAKQTPLYGDIPYTDHEGGDFVLRPLIVTPPPPLVKLPPPPPSNPSDTTTVQGGTRGPETGGTPPPRRPPLPSHSHIQIVYTDSTFETAQNIKKALKDAGFETELKEFSVLAPIVRSNLPYQHDRPGIKGNNLFYYSNGVTEPTVVQVGNIVRPLLKDGDLTNRPLPEERIARGLTIGTGEMLIMLNNSTSLIDQLSKWFSN